MKNLMVYALLVFACIFNSCKEDNPPKQTKQIQLAVDDYFPTGDKTFFSIAKNVEIATDLGYVVHPFQIESIQYLFGGTGNTPVEREFNLKIYKENGSIKQDDLLFSKQVTLTSSDTTMHELDISDENISLPEGTGIIVSFEALDDLNFPGFAVEQNGSMKTFKNLIKRANGVWTYAEFEGFLGNFVIRADVIITF